jgi:hypothetical protein
VESVDQKLESIFFIQAVGSKVPNFFVIINAYMKDKEDVIGTGFHSSVCPSVRPFGRRIFFYLCLFHRSDHLSGPA